ncbi:MAG: Dabb family protein [Verrucomicrobiales bacterium]
MKSAIVTILLALAMTLSTAAAADPVLRHVVCFKFKPGATAEQIKKVETEFVALKGKITEIAALEWGTDNSPEKLANGFTHCFIVTFKSEADRDAYLPHPEHKKFVEILKPILEKPFVIDFWTK